MTHGEVSPNSQRSFACPFFGSQRAGFQRAVGFSPRGPWCGVSFSPRDDPRKLEHAAPYRLPAMTLLETVLALSLMSTISLAAVLGVRVSWQAWSIQDQRSDTFQHLNGLLTHVTRHLRSTRSVVAVSAATDTSGYITITLPDDSVVKWDHDVATSQVLYGVDPPTDLLATGIDSLKFECFEIDGVTPTIVPADIRMIRTTASVTIPVQGTPFPLSSTVWIRKQQDALAAEYVDFYASAQSGGASWDNKTNMFGPPDGLLSYGVQGARVKARIVQSAYSGTLGTVLAGLYLKTEAPMGDDVLEIQIEHTDAGDGPLHTFKQRSLLRFENDIDWFWVDVTNDYGSWTYADLDNIQVKIENVDAGAGGSTIYVDSVVIRTFETAALTQNFWLTGGGPTFNEWGNTSGAVGPLDGNRANSTIFSVSSWDIDRQDYTYTGSWEDLGTIISVKLRIADFFMTATVVDDKFHVRLPTTTEPGETQDTAAPSTAAEVPINKLNQHVGIANAGSKTVDFSNLEAWTWPGIRSRFVRLYMSAIGFPETEIYVDGVRLKVRYVPPTEAAVVLWEEL